MGLGNGAVSQNPAPLPPPEPDPFTTSPPSVTVRRLLVHPPDRTWLCGVAASRLRI